MPTPVPVMSTSLKTITEFLTRKQLSILSCLFRKDTTVNPPIDHDIASLTAALPHKPSPHSLRFSLRALENRLLIESVYELRRERQVRVIKLTDKGRFLIRSETDPRWMVSVEDDAAIPELVI